MQDEIKSFGMIPEGVPIPLEKILSVDVSRRYFREFLEIEHSEENLDFFIDIEKLEKLKHDKVRWRNVSEQFITNIWTQLVHLQSTSLGITNKRWQNRFKVEKLIRISLTFVK